MGQNSNKIGNRIGRFNSLTGDRLRTYQKYRLLGVVLGIVGAGVLIVAGSFHSDTIFLAAWGFILVCGAVLAGIQLEKRETYWQLWRNERSVQKQKAESNLNDLEEYVKSVEKGKK